MQSYNYYMTAVPIDFIRRCQDYKSGFEEYSESDSWLPCSINGSYYLCLFYV